MTADATGRPASYPPRDWPRLVANTVLAPTDTRVPVWTRLIEATSGDPPHGRAGEVVAVASRQPGPPLLTVAGDPWVMQAMAETAGLKPFVVAVFGADGQMRAITRG